ncbi:MAG: hypothetical protein QOF21_681 [Actinomycetota bacterium]|jgi:hypothetical protein
MTNARTLLIAALTLGALNVVGGAPFGRERVAPSSVTGLVSGVWWAGQVAALPAGPPPAQVPAGGLWVSSTAAGTIAESAVRFIVGENDRQPILTLPIAMLTSPPKTAAPVDVDLHVLACAATGDWAPPPAGTFGALSAAPAYDCGKGQVLGALTPDAKGLEFELSQFVTATNKVVSVVVIPAPIPAPIPTPPVALPASPPPVFVPPNFDITFNPVTAAAIEVLTADSVTEDDFGFEPFDESYNPSAIEFALGNPAVPRPSRGIAALPGRVVRQLASVKPDPQTSQRTIAAVVFALLCAWAWLLNRDPVPGAPAGRPFRTLYDAAPPPAAPKRGFGTRVRAGKPPPLR